MSLFLTDIPLPHDATPSASIVVRTNAFHSLDGIPGEEAPVPLFFRFTECSHTAPVRPTLEKTVARALVYDNIDAVLPVIGSETEPG